MRARSTTIDNYSVREGFGLLDNWKTVEKTDTGRMISVELTLNEWLFNAAVGREVLTLNRDYFRLDGGLEHEVHDWREY
jgi:plasmid replication initiation protein